jgi:hypothetical protein
MGDTQTDGRTDIKKDTQRDSKVISEVSFYFFQNKESRLKIREIKMYVYFAVLEVPEVFIGSYTQQVGSSGNASDL